MSLGHYDLEIDEGATFIKTFYFENADGTVFPLTSYTNAKASIKEQYTDASPLAVFSCSIDEPGGSITITMANTFTAALPFNKHGKGVWDLFVTDALGNVIKAVSGSVCVLPRVTT